MALELQIDLQIVLDEDVPNTSPESWGPAQLIHTPSESLRRRIAIPADENHTLSHAGTSESGPFIWLLVNVHATVAAKIGFGQAYDMTIQPGKFAMWQGTRIPYAQGDGAEGELLYWCIAETIS